MAWAYSHVPTQKFYTPSFLHPETKKSSLTSAERQTGLKKNSSEGLWPRVFLVDNHFSRSSVPQYNKNGLIQ